MSKEQDELAYQELIAKVATINKEQDELAYQELIAKVATINKDAADYMQGPMRKIKGFTVCGDLWSVVVWEDTLQGTDFWYDIACKLEADDE